MCVYNDTRIGKTESDFFSVHQGMNSIDIQVPLEGLADGAYHYEISILQRSHSYAREKCDCIPNTLPIIIHNQEVFGFKGDKWYSNYWGHMMLKPIIIKK